MSNNLLNFKGITEGLELPEVKSEPITRRQLVDYASASGDYNLLHYDELFAKNSGLKGCIAHGMLQMAMVGSYILNWAKGGKLKNFKIRYSAPADENDILIFNGKIIKKFQENNENIIEITFISKNQDKRVTNQGSALIAIKK